MRGCNCGRSPNSALARIPWWRLPGVKDDAFAEQAEGGAAIHLPFEHLVSYLEITAVCRYVLGRLRTVTSLAG
jgi:hypothetical protein